MDKFAGKLKENGLYLSGEWCHVDNVKSIIEHLPGNFANSWVKKMYEYIFNEVGVLKIKDPVLFKKSFGLEELLGERSEQFYNSIGLCPGISHTLRFYEAAYSDEDYKIYLMEYAKEKEEEMEKIYPGYKLGALFNSSVAEKVAEIEMRKRYELYEINGKNPKLKELTDELLQILKEMQKEHKTKRALK